MIDRNPTARGAAPAARLAAWSAVLLTLVLGPAATPALAFGVADPTPFHLAPGDHFTLDLTGIALGGGETVVVRFTHVGSLATTDEPAESLAAAAVGVRVPAAAAVGQYDVEVLVDGTPSDPGPASIWVRDLPFSFIRESIGNLPTQPDEDDVDYKDSDFADVDNDGFLDILEAVSQSTGDVPANHDQLYINQLGKPAARDCVGTSFFCNQTSAQYDQAPGGIDPNNRTYDADLVDVDLDGDLDVVRIDQAHNATVRLLLNDGGGNFTDVSLARLPPLGDLGDVLSRAVEVDAGDADGDGRPDLVICTWTAGSGPGWAGQNALLLNRLHTTGRFELANDLPCDATDPGAHALCQISGQNNRGCAFAQLDGGGGLDLFFSSISPSQGDTVLLHTGNTGGIPQYDVRDDWVVAAGGGTPAMMQNGDVKVADLDGDLDDDVVVSDPQDGASAVRRILWNDGGTRLVELAASRYPATGNDYDVSFADLDRDGDLDLLFGSRNFAFGPVLINKGGADANMRFAATPASGFWLARSPGGVVEASSAFDFGLSVSAGDYDLDGDHDLVTGGFGQTSLWSSDLFQKPGQARDWIFLLDRTRSMVSGARDFFEPAKNVLATFSVQRRDDDAVGFVSFDYTGPDPGNPNAPDNANKAQRVVEVGDQSFFALADTIRAEPLGACSGRCTAIGWALQTGMDMAADAPVPDPDLPREQVLVLATDGEQNQAPHPDEIIPDIPSHVQLYVVAMGTDTDDRMLSALATNGGKFYFVGRSDDYTSVQNDLREVNNDIEGDATGKQPLLPFSSLGWSKALTGVLAESPVVRRVLGGQIAPSVFVALPRRQRWHFLVDPADREVRFTLSWRNPDRTVEMLLVDPRGQTVPIAGNEEVRQERWTRALASTVRDPLSGVWSIELVGGGDLGPVKATGMASSGLTVVGAPEHPLFYVGERLVVRARAGDPEPVPGVRGEARFTSPAEEVVTVGAQADSRGQLVFASPAATESGSWRAEVTVFGPPSRPFTRFWTAGLHVAEPTPDEVDLRNAELELDRTRLPAGGGETATATLRLRRRDGDPLVGARVSFVVRGGTAVGPPTDHGDGRYSQEVAAGRLAGRGEVRARAGLVLLPNRAGFEITAGAVDPARSSVAVIVGPGALCTNQAAEQVVQVVAVDAAGNGIAGAEVEIEQTEGHEVRWRGAVEDLGGGRYQRRFTVARLPGTVRFAATVDGVAVESEPVLELFDAESDEGRFIGCEPGPIPDDGGFPGCSLWMIVVAVLLAILLLVLAVLWWRRRRGGA